MRAMLALDESGQLLANLQAVHRGAHDPPSVAGPLPTWVQPCEGAHPHATYILYYIMYHIMNTLLRTPTDSGVPSSLGLDTDTVDSTVKYIRGLSFYLK
eukprot:9066179-Pyramimonas_sp.AAC.1